MIPLLDIGKRCVQSLATVTFPTSWKKFNELAYWKRRKRVEGQLSHDHYQYFYTTHFGLTPSEYNGKRILDIGCGPRGSLEWASMAAARIGLDPLADEYRRLGADQHAMEYIASGSETIPLPDGECDVVCSFNSLDHVGDVRQTLREIKRVTKPAGIFLLLVEVNHAPTSCEPHQLRPRELLDALSPEFECQEIHNFQPTGDGMYDSIRKGRKFTDPLKTSSEGYLSVLARRT